MNRNWPVLFAAAVLLTGVLAGPGFALEARLSSALGYDDNADERPGGFGTGFLEVSGSLEKRLFSETSGQWDLFLYGDGLYHHRFRVEDRGEMGLGMSVARPVFNDRWIPGLALEGRFFRDEFTPEDDRNQWRLRLQLDFLAASTVTVGLTQELGRADYRNDSSGLGGGDASRPSFSPIGRLRTFGPPGNRPPGGPGNGSGPGNGDGNPAGGAADLLPDREDDLSATRAWAVFHPSPSLRLELEGNWTRVDSTLGGETFSGFGGRAEAAWLADPWEMRISAAGYRDDYDGAALSSKNALEERDEVTWVLGGEIRRDFGIISGWIDLRWTDMDSSAGEFSYRKTVTRCGVSWPF